MSRAPSKRLRAAGYRLQATGASPEARSPEPGARSLPRPSRHLLVALLFLILPHLVYAFLWWGESPQTLGNDYTSHQPGQQLLFMQSIRDGYFPLWAPAESGGMPFAGYLFTGAYSPITWLLLGCDAFFEGHQLTILTHLRLLALSMSGFFTYLILRRFDLATLPAVVGASVFIFNLRMLDAFRFAMALDTVVWLPVVVYCIERLLAKPRVASALAVTLSQYMMLVAGQTQQACYCISFTILYFAVRLAIDVPAEQSGRRLKWLAQRFTFFGGSQLLSLGLWSVMLIPFIQDVLPLWTWHSAQTAGFADTNHLTWSGLLYNLVYPWMADVNAAFGGALTTWILVLLSAVCLRLYWKQMPTRQRRLAAFFLAVFVCTVLYSLGPLTPFAALINRLVPPYQWFRHPGRIMTVGMFAASFLVALGVQALPRIQPRGGAIFRIATLGCLAYAIAGVLLAVSIKTGWILVRDDNVSVPVFWNISKWSPAILHGATQMLPTMARTMIVAALVTLAVILLYRYRRISQTVLIVTVFIVMLAEAGVYHSHGTWMLEGRARSAHAADFSKADAYHTRIYWRLPFYVCNPDPVEAIEPQGGIRLREISSDPLRALLMHGGVPAWAMYFLDVPGHELPRAYVTPSVSFVEQDPLAAIAQMDPYVTSVIDVADPVNQHARSDAALKALSQIEVDTSRTDSRERFDALNSSVEVAEYTFNLAAFEVSTSTGGLFNYTDSFAKGWRATIDGNPVPVYRSNHMFKAVVLPPGRHVVKFVYDPASVRAALPISMACWCLVFALGGSCLSTVVRRRILLAVLAAGLTAVAASSAHTRLYQMAYRGGRINYDPNQIRAEVRYLPALTAGYEITVR